MDALIFDINTTSFSALNTASINTAAAAVMSRTLQTVYVQTTLNINLTLPT